MANISKALAVAVFGLALSIFSTQASAQLLPSPPPVYVSGSVTSGGITTSTIYVQSGTGFTPIFSMANANLESLAIGPDNADTDAAGNAAHPYLLYACDPAGSIIRFDPTAAVIAVQSVASLAIAPVCGRSTATEDFYVTNKSGPGVYQLIAPGSVALGNVPYNGQTAIGASAMRISSFNNMMGRGIAQKYVGDLLVVDNAGNQVLRSASPLFTTLSPFITSNLNGPVGIANAPSLRQEFVSNGNSATQNAVTVFDATGAPATAPCSSLSLPKNNREMPSYLATAPTSTNTVVNDTIYLVTGSSKSGTLWTFNTAQGNCNLNMAASGAALSGVAVAPAPVTLTLPLTGTAANPVPTPFFFNSNLFQLTAGGCNATVTAFPLIPATVNHMITLANPANPETPGVNLGDGGFLTAYLANNPTCGSILADGGVRLDISNFVADNQFSNPRALDCFNSNHATEPQLGTTTCVVLNTVGVYPVGGPIPGDGSIGGSGGSTILHNFFAVVNEKAGAGTAQPGQFCGYENPLINPGQPGYPKVFTSPLPNTVNVKFKIADLNRGGNCQSGPYLSDGVSALISVAQLTPAFNAINVLSTASSIDVTPFYNPGNNQFSFTLNFTAAFVPGTYSLTTTFLTDNFASVPNATPTATILFIIQ